MHYNYVMKSFAYIKYLKIITKAVAQGAADFANPLPCHESVQSSAHPSIFRHDLSRCGGPLKSTRFYYPAKIFRLLFKTVMTMIRALISYPDRHAFLVAVPARMQAST